MLDIGKWVKEKRKEMNMRQVDLSNLSDVPVRTIQSLETGIHQPSIFTAQLVIDAMGYELRICDKGIGAEMSNWMYSCEYLAEESTCEADCDCKYKMYDCNPDGSVNCYICGWNKKEQKNE